MRDVSLRKRISDRIGGDSKRIMLEFGLALLAVLAISPVIQAATGDLVGNVTFSQNCNSGVGVGITYDGTNLWYSCYANQTDLLRADPVTGTVTASYQLNNGLGALSYDATHNVIWAGQGAGNGSNGDIFKIQLDAGKNVTGITTQFTIPNSTSINNVSTVGNMPLDDGLAFDARNIADPSDDVVYFSPDTATIINVFNLNGTFVQNFTWTGSTCVIDGNTQGYNSGLAIGGNGLFQGSNGCNHVWVVNKTTLAPLFDFNTSVAGDPNFRDEGLTCDPNTFAPIDVEWSKEAYSPMRAHAFEIPKGSCGVGGQPSGPSFTVTKDFRFTDVNFTATPAQLGTLLPMNGSKFNVSYVIQPKTGTVASTNPGQLYGVVTINGTGVQNITINDTFGTQFVINPAHIDGGVDVLRVNTTTGIATVITDTQVTASSVSATGPVDLTINLTTPLASDETVMVYIKYMTSLKGMLPDYSDFVNTAVVTTNLDGSKTATTTINFVPHA